MGSGPSEDTKGGGGGNNDRSRHGSSLPIFENGWKNMRKITLKNKG